MPLKGQIKDITGSRFGRLVAIKFSHRERDKTYWEYQCDCGNKTIKASGVVHQGSCNSCGCIKEETHKKHGYATRNNKRRVYRIWQGMRERCKNPSSISYPFYGAKGITYDPAWDDFSTFIKDMGEPRPKQCLDRIDNTKSYSKCNCRWVSYSKNNSNTSRSKIWHINGKTYNRAQDAANDLNVDQSTISKWCNSRKPGCWCELKYS